jgi:DNA-binding CsgD family transcriptional regulator/Tfp pilus assembly protein PilF
VSETVGLLESAQSAFGRGDFARAASDLQLTLELEESSLARRLLGVIAYADDDFERARREWEQAFALLRTAGELRTAALVATDLAELHGNTLGNAAAGNGWIARARRLLERVGPCVEWGYLELALMACERTDIDDLLRSTERAFALAAEFGDLDLEVRALADSGLGLVTSGRVREGFDRLDEALAIIAAGEVQSVAVVGKSFCSMLSSCDRAGDVRRAEEWNRLIQAMVLDRFEGRPRILHTHCRAAYGSVLCSAGRWVEAEAAMLEVLGPTGSQSVGHRADTTANLAALRVEQGRIEEAAELLAPYEDRVTACAPIARVHLVRGDVALAAAVLERGLRELVGDALRSGVLLALLVEAELQRGEIEAAALAAARLQTLADAADSNGLQGEAALAHARVLAGGGDHNAAVAAFEQAKQRLRDGERPLLSGLVSLDLAATYAAAGRDSDAIAEARGALAIFERLGARSSRDRAIALLRRLGVATRPGGPTAASALDSLTPRESEVLALIGQGLSNAEIGARLYISPKTAEHHVGRILGKLAVRNRAEAAALAANGVASER